MDALVRLLRNPVVVRVAGLLIGITFVAAALAKVGDPGAFSAQIHNFRLAPIWSENLLAVTLPWIELVVGLALILGMRSRAAGWLVSALMVLFTVAVGQAALRGLDIQCGCFGTGDATEVGVKKLAENIGLTLLALISALRPRATEAASGARLPLGETESASRS